MEQESTKKLKKEVGQRIRKLREAMGLSVYEMGHMLNINPKSIKGWETGDVRMKLDSLIKLVEFFNVTVDFLLGIKD